MIQSRALSDLVTVTAQLGSNHTVRGVLRNHFANKIGLKPNQTTSQYVFYRQQLQSTTCEQAYTEWCALSQQDDQSSVHLILKFHPSLVIKETDWFPLIRYCLKSVSCSAATCVVFTKPQKGKTLDLFIRQPALGDELLLSAEEQRLVYQMMAIRIALYFEQPLYTNWLTPSQYQSAYWQFEGYINGAVYQALANARVHTTDELLRLLTDQYGIQAKAQRKNSKLTKLSLRYKTSSWLNLNNADLSLSVINGWLLFNGKLAHTALTDIILSGPTRLHQWGSDSPVSLQMAESEPGVY